MVWQCKGGHYVETEAQKLLHTVIITDSTHVAVRVKLLYVGCLKDVSIVHNVHSVYTCVNISQQST